jgi:hypothetical protein
LHPGISTKEHIPASSVRQDDSVTSSPQEGYFTHQKISRSHNTFENAFFLCTLTIHFMSSRLVLIINECAKDFSKRQSVLTTFGIKIFAEITGSCGHGF